MSFGGDEGTFYSEFILEPDGEGTKVTWTYEWTKQRAPLERRHGLLWEPC